jgi:outer membrane protein assembly factor BamB
VRSAVSLRTGKRLWHRAIAPNTSDPVAATFSGSSLLRFSGDRAVSIDPRKGTLRWSKKIPRGSDAVKSLDTCFAAAGNHLFTGGRELFALRASDGEVIWRLGKGRKFGDTYDPAKEHYGPPVVKDGVVFCMERGNGLIALDAERGDLLWEEKKEAGRQMTTSEAYESTPLVGEKYFYCAPEDNRWARAVDLRTHRTAWTFQGPSGDKDNFSPSIMAAHHRAGMVIITNGKTVCAIPLE